MVREGGGAWIFVEVVTPSGWARVSGWGRGVTAPIRWELSAAGTGVDEQRIAIRPPCDGRRDESAWRFSLPRARPQIAQSSGRRGCESLRRDRLYDHHLYPRLKSTLTTQRGGMAIFQCSVTVIVYLDTIQQKDLAERKIASEANGGCTHGCWLR